MSYCSPEGAGHGHWWNHGRSQFVGDVAASRDPIQRLGFNYFHVLGSPLFELFLWPRPATVIVPVGVGALLMPDRPPGRLVLRGDLPTRKKKRGGRGK